MHHYAIQPDSKAMTVALRVMTGLVILMGIGIVFGCAWALTN